MSAKVAMSGYTVKVEEVEVTDVPVRRKGKWTQLISDMALRLERTSNLKALKYTFPRVKEARNARMAVRKHFKRQGMPIVTVVQPDGDSGVLYVFKDKEVA